MSARGDERIKNAAHDSTILLQLLIRERAQQLQHVGVDALTRCRERLGQVVHDRSQRRLACASLQYLDSYGVSLEDTFRREQDPAALRFVMRQPNTPWQ